MPGIARSNLKKAGDVKASKDEAKKANQRNFRRKVLILSRISSQRRKFPRSFASFRLSLVDSRSTQLLASPNASTTHNTKTNHFFDRKLNPIQLGKWSQDPENRRRMWDAMLKIVGV
ncbi:hypothetical protein DFH06DRAFT_1297214 [Mycena polygramma]|nr:hypothetical protein DFH06DRAFT_1297214 [Mycena polygramma]